MFGITTMCFSVNFLLNACISVGGRKIGGEHEKIGGDDGECNKKVPSNLFLRNSCHMEW